MPVKTIIKGVFIESVGIMGWENGLIYIQFIKAPIIIAPILKFIVGVLKIFNSLLIFIIGVENLGLQITKIIIRTEYLAVKIVADINIIIIIGFINFSIEISKIKSLE